MRQRSALRIQVVRYRLLERQLRVSFFLLRLLVYAIEVLEGATLLEGLDLWHEEAEHLSFQEKDARSFQAKLKRLAHLLELGRVWTRKHD